MGKLSLYWHTLKHLRPEQIIWRIAKKMKMNCTIGVKADAGTTHDTVCLLPQLDFDTIFLDRFPVEALLKDRVTLLNETEVFHWNTPWRFDNRSALWNYNLHYCEYLLALVKAWQETRQRCCLEKIQEIIQGWIRQNPKLSGGAGWDAYPVSLRLIVWMSCYGYLENDLEEPFKRVMLDSMAEQYAHLATHLEKHLLGNHYFENLKTLVICSLFFRDQRMTERSLQELKKQCAEQILPDGMHFELSPMYHKIILEDLLRVCMALRQTGRQDEQLENYLQPMLDAAYSLEEGLERIPLFNDCGNNVAKSLAAILAAAEAGFGLGPQYKPCLPDSGYYILKNGSWKLIADAGQPGPKYNPGHAHCDAMSFELFQAGKPVLVNCGTYAYQCKERSFFRSTAAHNTVQAEGVEQSRCWGVFRMAKGCRVKVIRNTPDALCMEMTDQGGCRINRSISMGKKELEIRDSAETKIVTHMHYLPGRIPEIKCVSDSVIGKREMLYAEAYGSLSSCCALKLSGGCEHTVAVALDQMSVELKE